MLEHEGEEIAFVQEGKVKLYLDDNEIILDTGDNVRIPRCVLHKWENPYETDASVIFAITP